MFVKTEWSTWKVLEMYLVIKLYIYLYVYLLQWQKICFDVYLEIN